MAETSSEQIAKIRSVLNARRRALLDEVRESLENTENQQYVEIVGRAPTEAGDASVSDELADLNLSMLDRHIAELREIDAAEQRLRDGTYGDCTECGGEIGIERLLAQPTAARCVRCQERYEKTHATQSTPTL